MPRGFTDDGLPIGPQIVGRLHEDPLVPRAAAAYERLAPWADKRPELTR